MRKIAINTVDELLDALGWLNPDAGLLVAHRHYNGSDDVFELGDVFVVADEVYNKAVFGSEIDADLAMDWLTQEHQWDEEQQRRLAVEEQKERQEYERLRRKFGDD